MREEGIERKDRKLEGPYLQMEIVQSSTKRAQMPFSDAKGGHTPVSWARNTPVLGLKQGVVRQH